MKNLILALGIVFNILFITKFKGSFDIATAVYSITGTIFFVTYLLMNKIEELKNK